MSGERKLTMLSVLLLVGLNLMIFTVSPIIETSIRAQIQVVQISILVLAAAVTIAFAVSRKDSAERPSRFQE
jgi:hypothetical protein